MRTGLGVTVVLLVCAVAIIVALAGRPTNAHAVSLPAGYHVVHVEEYDYGFRVSETTMPAGKVVFVDTNRGTIAHEFVLFKTDSAAAKLPLNKDKSVNEDSDALESAADSGSSLAPGETRLITADLDAGHYALVCNLAGHYQAGMRQDLTAK